jgi:hypothetical protein
MRGVGLLVLVLVLTAACSSGGPATPSAVGSPTASAGAGDRGGPGTGSSDGTGSTSSPGPAGTAAATPPPLSRTDPPTIGPARPPKRPSDNFKPIVTSGTVHISPGCIDLVTNSNVIWTLFGAVAKGLKEGDQVRVTGQPAVQLESSCRGSPLAVLTATRI